MKSFLREIESKFEELNEKEDLDVDAIIQQLDTETKVDIGNDTFSLGNSSKNFSRSFLLNPLPPSRFEDYVNSNFSEIEKEDLHSIWNKYRAIVKEKPQKGQDSDGDGTWYEPHGDRIWNDPSEDVNEADVVVNDPTEIGAVRKELGPKDRIVVDDELEEMSSTGGVPGYQTPNAFSTPAQAKKKKNMKYETVHKAMDTKYEALIESYSKFATGNPKSTPSQTVNGTIKNVAKKLQEIEQLIRYTSRLKNESGIAGSTFGTSTHNALNKISERLLKISERIRSLGE